MKKTFVIFAIALAVVTLAVGAVFAGTTLVNAQTPTPGDPSYLGGGRMMAGDGLMDETMHAILAEKLGLSVAELDALIAEGKTVVQIAEEQGLSADEITTLMQEARSAALDQMVADGVITQEQADWMEQRGAGMMGGRGYSSDGGCQMWNSDGSVQNGTGANPAGSGMSRGSGRGRSR